MTVEVVVFPHVEKALVAFLTAELTARGKPSRVATTVPAQRPDRLVVVTRAGGVRRDLVTDEATVLVECWDTTETLAFDLANLCRGLIEAAARDVEPVSAGVFLGGYEEFGGPVRFPDPATRNPRYQFTVSLALTGHAL